MLSYLSKLAPVADVHPALGELLGYLRVAKEKSFEELGHLTHEAPYVPGQKMLQTREYTGQPADRDMVAFGNGNRVHLPTELRWLGPIHVNMRQEG